MERPLKLKTEVSIIPLQMLESTLTKDNPHVLHSDWVMSPVAVLEFVHGDPLEAATPVTLPEWPLTNTPNASACGRAPNNVHSSRRQDEPSPHRPSVDCPLVRVRVLRGPRVNSFRSRYFRPNQCAGYAKGRRGCSPARRIDVSVTISVPASTVVAVAVRVEHAEGAIPPEVE